MGRQRRDAHVVDVEKEGVLFGEAVVDRPEPEDEAARGTATEVGSASVFAPANTRSREQHARRNRDERHVDGGANHVLSAVRLARDEEQDAADEVGDERRAQREPELVHARDERLRRLRDDGRDVVMKDRVDCGDSARPSECGPGVSLDVAGHMVGPASPSTPSPQHRPRPQPSIPQGRARPPLRRQTPPPSGAPPPSSPSDPRISSTKTRLCTGGLPQRRPDLRDSCPPNASEASEREQTQGRTEGPVVGHEAGDLALAPRNLLLAPLEGGLAVGEPGGRRKLRLGRGRRRRQRGRRLLERVLVGEGVVGCRRGGTSDRVGARAAGGQRRGPWRCNPSWPRDALG